jgi:hypothetical protein
MPPLLHRLIRSPGVIVSTVLAMIAAAYARIFFGVELTDEAQYMGQIYTVYLGGKLFFADLFFQQLGSVLFYPIFYPFFEPWGHDFPMFLLGRHLYFLMTIAGAYSFYSLLTRWLLRMNALLVSTLVIIFVPFSIPNVSYNTAGYLSFLMFMCWGYRGSHDGGRAWHLVLSGACAAVTAVVYPTLTVGIVTFVGMLTYRLFRADRPALLRTLAFWASGALPVAACLFGALMSYGHEGLQESIGFTEAFGFSLASRTYLLFRNILKDFPKPLFLLILGSIWFYRKHPTEDRVRKLYYSGVFLLLSSLCMLVFRSSLFVIIYMTLACLLPFRLFKIQPLSDPKHLKLLVIPSITGGVCTGWTSTNSLMNAALGLVPGLAALLAFYFIECGHVPSSSPLKGVLAVQYRGVVLLILLVTLTCYYAYPYREDPVPTLTQRVTRGPYSGLYTTGARKAYVDEFMSIVDELRPLARTITFMDELPIGYLFSDLAPKSRMLMLHSFPYEGTLNILFNSYYGDPANLPDALVIRDEGPRQGGDYPLKRHILASDDYRLFRSITDHQGTTVRFLLRQIAEGGELVRQDRGD